jgi:hypothetical protein
MRRHLKVIMVVNGDEEEEGTQVCPHMLNCHVGEF